MAAITHYIPADTTEQQSFTARTDGTTVDMSAYTPSLEVTDKNGASVTVTGTVAWVDASVASWGYTPDGQLTPALSPYSVRLRVTGADIVKFPNGRDADVWWVVEP